MIFYVCGLVFLVARLCWLFHFASLNLLKANKMCQFSIYIYTYAISFMCLCAQESERKEATGSSIHGHFITQRWPSVLLLLLRPNATERRQPAALEPPPSLQEAPLWEASYSRTPHSLALRLLAASIVLVARACTRFMHSACIAIFPRGQFRFQFKADARFNCMPGEL